MKKFIVLIFILFCSHSLAGIGDKYQVISGSYYITEQFSIIPTVNYYSENYRPKFFPRDYEIYFQTEEVYRDFEKNAVVLLEKQRIACVEYVVYRGQVILKKRYQNHKICDESDILKQCSRSYRTGNTEVVYGKSGGIAGYFESCRASISYMGRAVNLEENLNNQYPQSKENSSTKDIWYILDNGSLISTQKFQHPTQFYEYSDGVYFETKKAKNLFYEGRRLEKQKKSFIHPRAVCLLKRFYLGYESGQLNPECDLVHSSDL